GADAPKVDVIPNMQSLGDVPPGQTGAPVTFTIKNVGGLRSGLPAFAFQPTNVPFAISQNFCTFQLDSGATCQIGVTFTAPGTFGQIAGQLVASANPGGSAIADLTGNSTFIEVTPSPFDFGDAVAGTGAKVQDFTVWRLGPPRGPLPLRGMINGSHANAFMIMGGWGVNGVSPASSCTITVAFKPGAVGPKFA